MSFIIKKNIWNLKNNQITDEIVFKNRREILKKITAGTLAFSSLAYFPHKVFSSTNEFYPPKVNNSYTVNRKLTKEGYATTYTNFYEFGSSKNIWRRAAKLKTKPWSLTINGLVKKPLSIDVYDLLKKIGGIEERVYRFRCVEAWSMTVPWSGFPLNKLLELVEPKADAKFVKFETFFNPEVAPGQKQKWYPWPYQEGITIEEAKNNLSFIATGIYGKELPNQNGAPLRLVLPWKYGFKSIKSIVNISFVSERPIGLWEKIAPSEYGFWANVNPEIPHPRWSQSTEQQLGVDGRVQTEIYNGYGHEVASMYVGLQSRLKDSLFR
ncbi:protein-methionine-sulfoxide reductase catalytic subunit MsrP [Alphaproteobacteria bacterium]|nr:protein-methionine-sulfoxide reductase catalytic subunit MsrP [Alphaproteobacteria bacterium]